MPTQRSRIATRTSRVRINLSKVSRETWRAAQEPMGIPPSKGTSAIMLMRNSSGPMIPIFQSVGTCTSDRDRGGKSGRALKHPAYGPRWDHESVGSVARYLPVRCQEPETEVENKDSGEDERQGAFRQPRKEQRPDEGSRRAADRKRQDEAAVQQVGAVRPALKDVRPQVRDTHHRNGEGHVEQKRQDRNRHDRRACAHSAFDKAPNADCGKGED